MKKIIIFLVICIAMMTVGDALAQRSRNKNKRRSRPKTTKVVTSKKSRKKAVAKKTTKKKNKKTVAVRPKPIINLEDNDDNPYIRCEDTCDHVHGIDLSHYQGEVFWETVGNNTKMAYVYLKATEGGDRIDA